MWCQPALFPCSALSGGKEREGDLQYYPFRMTPYLMKVQDSVHAEDPFCCLLLAERVHSGYEGKAATSRCVFTAPSTCTVLEILCQCIDSLHSKIGFGLDFCFQLLESQLTSGSLPQHILLTVYSRTWMRGEMLVFFSPVTCMMMQYVTVSISKFQYLCCVHIDNIYKMWVVMFLHYVCCTSHIARLRTVVKQRFLCTSGLLHCWDTYLRIW